MATEQTTTQPTITQPATTEAMTSGPTAGAGDEPTVRISGVHHLAINTADMVGQIEYFSDVLGAELVALFWMHGVPGGKHCFMRLNDHCSFSLVDLPANHEIDATLGVTHAGTGAGPSAPGTLQHLAFRVDSLDELRAIRDRIRSRGVNVFGDLDHGMCHSIYFAGLEGLTLEVATSTAPIDPAAWIDPEVVEQYGIDADQLARFVQPAAYAGEGGTVAQPPIDPDKPHMAYPRETYEEMLGTPDEIVLKYASFPDPPVTIT